MQTTSAGEQGKQRHRREREPVVPPVRRQRVIVVDRCLPEIQAEYRERVGNGEQGDDQRPAVEEAVVPAERDEPGQCPDEDHGSSAFHDGPVVGRQAEADVVLGRQQS